LITTNSWVAVYVDFRYLLAVQSVLDGEGMESEHHPETFHLVGRRLRETDPGELAVFGFERLIFKRHFFGAFAVSVNVGCDDGHGILELGGCGGNHRG
jgi:hypothetical protein